MAGKKKKERIEVNFDPLPGPGKVAPDGQSIQFANGAVFKRTVLPAAYAKTPDNSDVDLSLLEDEDL